MPRTWSCGGQASLVAHWKSTRQYSSSSTSAASGSPTSTSWLHRNRILQIVEFYTYSTVRICDIQFKNFRTQAVPVQQTLILRIRVHFKLLGFKQTMYRYRYGYQYQRKIPYTVSISIPTLSCSNNKVKNINLYCSLTRPTLKCSTGWVKFDEFYNAGRDS